METRERLIHQICIAGIKRATFKPYDGYTWSKFYEENGVFENAFPGIELELLDNEQVICSTVLDLNNYSIITTRKLVTKENGMMSTGYFGRIQLKNYVKLEDVRDKKPLTYGAVILDNGDELRYIVETGYANMIMTHGLKTRLEAEKMTEQEISKLISVWQRQDNKREK